MKLNKRIRESLVLLNDVLIREPKLIFRYYFPFKRYKNKNIDEFNIFMADGKMLHGGMFDRLKGAISVYAISKIQNKPFKIHFISPFLLSKYLQPNRYDWTINADRVIFKFPFSRPLFLYGECYNPRRLMKKRKKQSHFYYGYDSLYEINKKFGTKFKWGELYDELFKPTEYLQNYIDYYKNDIGTKYIAIHTRFLNLLGDKVETSINPEASEERKQELVNKIEGIIRKISKENKGIKMLIASDSMVFLDHIKDKVPNIYIVKGKVRHIGTSSSTTDDDNIKMFLDYYMMAGAEKVYNIVAEGMWNSAFSEYAAKIGNVEFERIRV